jgi:hypothetical protein
MQFVSIEYLSFLAITAVANRLSKPRRRSHVLLITSYLFYCTWNWKLAILLFLVTAACYLAAIHSRQRQGVVLGAAIVFAAVSALVLMLAVFKVRPLFSPQNNWLLPLGISYYTFRLIGYLLDVYWGKCAPVQEFVPFAAYVAFFPQMVAGPIQRASSFMHQLQEGNRAQSKMLEGLLRIALGFGKKTIVADNLALFVGWAYQHLSGGSALPSLVALYLYPLQLYADFSGLTDIAIGSGLLLGIEAPENFDAPFSAKNITDFWRRWHMTLTGWLRDYVFMPLRMTTRDLGRAGLAISLTIDMVLIALWHGVAAGFLVYGLFHSVFLVSEGLTSSNRQQFYLSHPGLSKFADLLGPIFVYHVVAVGSVLFRAPSLGSAGQLFVQLGAGLRTAAIDLASLLSPPNHHAWVALPAFAFITSVDVLRRKHGFELPSWSPRYVKWSVYGSVAVMWVLIAMTLLATEKGADPFVYGLF